MSSGLAETTINELRGRMTPGIPVSVEALSQESGLSTSSIYGFKRKMLEAGWMTTNADNHLVLHSEQLPEDQREKPLTRGKPKKLTEQEIVDLMTRRNHLLREVEEAQNAVKTAKENLRTVQEDLRKGI